MKCIGPHVATTGGVQQAPLNARSIGATAFGLFTKNQRQWVGKPYEPSTILSFKRNLSECGYSSATVLAHDSYLINIGNPDPAMREKSLAALVDELTRCDQLGLTLLNIHPGSHLRLISEDECCALIAGSINQAHQATRNVTVVLENTAGQGSNIGYRFEHLAMIIDGVDDKSRVGCCIDTCHTFAAGYDFRTEQTYRATIDEFDRTVGLSYLRGLHINDSKGKLGSRIDRHHSIGEGEIGFEPFTFFMTDPRFDGLPMILETIDESRWPREIELLSRVAKGNLAPDVFPIGRID